jgi:hypothetical protein
VDIFLPSGGLSRATAKSPPEVQLTAGL